MKRMWVTVNKDKYYLTTATGCWYGGGFPRVLRVISHLISEGVEFRALVLPTLRIARQFSRVEDPANESLHEGFLKLLAKRKIQMVATPGAEEGQWKVENVKLPKVEAVEDTRLLVYTDGSCLGNPGHGGWGFTSRLGSSSGSEANVTNNMMEIRAVAEALKWCKKHAPGMPLKIISDSRYVVNGCTSWHHKWERREFQGIANAERWQQLVRALKTADVEFRWLKGHSGNPGNTEADRLAGEAARALRDSLK